LARKAKQAIRGWSIQPDAVQRKKKRFECRLILLGALNLLSKRLPSLLEYG
jgi:hypothetical protein